MNRLATKITTVAGALGAAAVLTVAAAGTASASTLHHVHHPRRHHHPVITQPGTGGGPPPVVSIWSQGNKLVTASPLSVGEGLSCFSPGASGPFSVTSVHPYGEGLYAVTLSPAVNPAAISTIDCYA